MALPWSYCDWYPKR